MAPQVTATVVDDDPESYESRHVHAVYDEIAPHFSSTRYKPWPIISQFISSLPAGWVGLDSGTGNGKYLPLPLDRPTSIWTIGLDRSRNLLTIAQKAGGVNREVVWGDALGQSFREGAFDYAISIATIHHLSTHERRKAAVQRLISAVSSSHGRVLVYVWAIEQDDLSKRTIPPAADHSNPGEDVFVPWVLSKDVPGRAKQRKQDMQGPASDGTVPEGEESTTKPDESPQIFNRYYHMFARGELTELVVNAASSMGLYIGSPRPNMSQGIEIVQDGWERSNYYVELRRWQS